MRWYAPSVHAALWWKVMAIAGTSLSAFAWAVLAVPHHVLWYWVVCRWHLGGPYLAPLVVASCLLSLPIALTFATAAALQSEDHMVAAHPLDHPTGAGPSVSDPLVLVVVPAASGFAELAALLAKTSVDVEELILGHTSRLQNTPRCAFLERLAAMNRHRHGVLPARSRITWLPDCRATDHPSRPNARTRRSPVSCARRPT